MFRSLMPFTTRRDVARAGDPFMSLQREMNRLFDDAFGGYLTPARTNGDGARQLVPSVDVKETDKAIEIEAELPGVEEKDVQVTLEDKVLTIKGEKKAEKEETKKDYYSCERSYGSFLRSFELPAGVDADKVSAAFSKGVLKVTVPKVPATQAKKIDVKTA